MFMEIFICVVSTLLFCSCIGVFIGYWAKRKRQLKQQQQQQQKQDFITVCLDETTTIFTNSAQFVLDKCHPIVRQLQLHGTETSQPQLIINSNTSDLNGIVAINLKSRIVEVHYAPKSTPPSVWSITLPDVVTTAISQGMDYLLLGKTLFFYSEHKLCLCDIDTALGHVNMGVVANVNLPPHNFSLFRFLNDSTRLAVGIYEQGLCTIHVVDEHGISKRVDIGVHSNHTLLGPIQAVSTDSDGGFTLAFMCLENDECHFVTATHTGVSAVPVKSAGDYPYVVLSNHKHEFSYKYNKSGPVQCRRVTDEDQNSYDVLIGVHSITIGDFVFNSQHEIGHDVDVFVTGRCIYVMSRAGIFKFLLHEHNVVNSGDIALPFRLGSFSIDMKTGAINMLTMVPPGASGSGASILSTITPRQRGKLEFECMLETEAKTELVHI